MIGYIEGKIVQQSARSVIVLTVSGVGYKLHVANLAIADPNADELYKFFVHHVVREDASDLYGFTDLQQQSLFEQLIGINGIGPKSALEMLTLPVQKIRAAIEQEDVKFLTQIKGLGKKTAERIILELKGKLPDLSDGDNAGDTDAGVGEDTLIALEQLGYKRAHISKVLDKMPEDVADPEEQIRYFLQNV